MATRINVSISADLKERMDKLTDVNWSKVAQEAFETHSSINELKGNNMETAAGIERLRASKAANAERETAEGFSIGKFWALEKAEYDDLAKVVELREREFDYLELAVAAGWPDADSRDANEAMESLFDRPEPSDKLMHGFVEGAFEVFQKV